MTPTANDTPDPPAAAYALVVGLLPDGYLTKPPPAEGVEVMVRGTDHVDTFWAMSREDAINLRQAIVARPTQLAWIYAHPYNDSPATPETPAP